MTVTYQRKMTSAGPRVFVLLIQMITIDLVYKTDCFSNVTEERSSIHMTPLYLSFQIISFHWSIFNQNNKTVKAIR